MTDPLKHAIEEGMAVIPYWVKEWKNGDPVYGHKLKHLKRARIRRASPVAILGEATDIVAGTRMLFQIGYQLNSETLETYGTAVADEQEANEMCNEFERNVLDLPTVDSELRAIINQELK